MNRAVYTIGYEGKSPDEFFSELKGNGIKCLLDIRIRPHSRKPGFSKSALQQRCELEGLTYVHERDLGTPERILDEFKQTGHYDWDGYLAFLKEQTEAIALGRELAAKYSTCLLCYEKDANVCHRRFVAAEIALTASMEIIHL